MPGIVQTNLDTAGGIIRPLQTWFTVDGDPAGEIGCKVDPHPPCPIPAIHCTAVMIEGVGWFTLDGIPVCVEGNHADCGHAATGRAWFTIG